MRTNFKQLSFVSAFFVTFSFAPLETTLLASEKNPEVVRQGYPSDFAANYLKACVSEVADREDMAKWLKPEQIKKLCGCTLERFQSKYKYSEFQALSKEQKEKEGYACVAKIMLGANPVR